MPGIRRSETTHDTCSISAAARKSWADEKARTSIPAATKHSKQRLSNRFVVVDNGDDFLVADRRLSLCSAFIRSSLATLAT